MSESTLYRWEPSPDCDASCYFNDEHVCGVGEMVPVKPVHIVDLEPMLDADGTLVASVADDKTMQVAALLPPGKYAIVEVTE